MFLEDRCNAGNGLRVHRRHVCPKVRTRTIPAHYLRSATLALLDQRLVDSLGKYREVPQFNLLGDTRVRWRGCLRFHVFEYSTLTGKFVRKSYICQKMQRITLKFAKRLLKRSKTERQWSSGRRA